MNANDLMNALHAAFDYTTDNNRDLIADETFPQADVIEELNVEWAYKFLVSYIARNTTTINAGLER